MRQEIKQALSLFVAVAGVALAGDVSALSQRTFVASTGLDASACTITAPCRSFAAAIAQTNTKGEVIVLDSAGYGPVTIAKSISLLAPAGIYAGVTVVSGDGIIVNAPGIIVILRGLSINGQGGQSGINLLQAARLRIENCVISGMAGDGILHTANGAALVVVDTVMRDNLGNGLDILADTLVVVDHVRSEHNQIDGFAMLTLNFEIEATITDSYFAFNGRHGINVQTSVANSTALLLVERSVIVDNAGDGIIQNGAHAGASATLTRNAIHRNVGDGIRIVAGGGFNSTASISENAISVNATDIRADGIGASVWVSANTMSIYDANFAQVNGGVFSSYRNNVGVAFTTGTITPVTGQ